MAKLRRPPPPSGAPGRKAFRFHERLALLAIIVAGLGAYANSLGGPFVFDDLRAIVDNETISQLWPLTSPLQPPRQTPVAGRPLANLSFAVNFALGGLQVGGYHVLNIAIHILAALALFGVVRRILRRTLPEDANPDLAALACALIWVVHPLNTDAVDYLTQRTESLMGLFYLLTLYASIRAWETPAGRWIAVAILANICGICTKESMVTLPFVLILCDRTFAYPSFSAAFLARRRLYFALAAGWVLFVALATQTPFFSPTGFDRQVSRWTYFLNQAPAVVDYLRLSIWPRGLVFDYGVPAPLTLLDVWPSALLVLALITLTIVALVRFPAVGFWGAWFFITLAPASSVIPIPTEVAAERRMYLPLVAIVVVTVLLGRRLTRSVLARAGGSAATRLVAPALVTTAVVLLGAGTLARNTEYRTGLSLWQTVLDRRPHARAHTNIAVYYRDAGQIDESLRHLRTAAPDWPDARFPLGSALIERGDVRGGVAQLEEFVRLRPDHAQVISAREELADALLRLGNDAQALAQLRQIVAIAPQYVRGHVNLGNMLASQRDFDGAVAEYRAALGSNPDNVGTLPLLTGLGDVLVKGGHDAEAISVLQRALGVDPLSVAARRVLLQALFNERRFGELEDESRKLISSAPHDADAHNQLGIALASQDRLDEAVEHFAEAVRLNPELRWARNNLALALDVRRRSNASSARRPMP